MAIEKLEVIVTLTDGREFKLESVSDLWAADRGKVIDFVFSDGTVWCGFYSGQNGNFIIIKAKTGKTIIGMPFDECIGWTYNKL